MEVATVSLHSASHDNFRAPINASRTPTPTSELTNGTVLMKKPSETRYPRREAELKEIEKLEQLKDIDRYELIHLLREKEMEIQSILEELERYQSQIFDLQTALDEAKTIISQQQDELSGWRIRAAQSATDAEAFKMKNMFLTNGAKVENAELANFRSTCDQLENELKTISGKLDESRKAQIRMQNENEYLKRQLEDVSYASTPNRISERMQSATPLEAEYTLDNVTMNAEREAMKIFAAQQEIMRREIIEDYDEEIAELHNHLRDWQLKENNWKQTESELIRQKEELMLENKKHLSVIESMLKTQGNNSRPTSEIDTSAASLRDTDLEEQLRRSNQERNRWKQYACSLVRAFVENCEEFIQKTSYEEPEITTPAERRWYDYSMYLLEVMLETAPHRLAEMDLQLLKRSMSARRPNTMTIRSASLINPSPDILSMVQMRSSSRPQKLTTSERVARIAVKPLFRYSMSERS